tara:strand:- start:31 stop:210 length:180 start_codon:yes stop_codon:yes gene_type:complete
LEIIKQTQEQWAAQQNSQNDEEEKNHNRGEEKGVIDNMNELYEEHKKMQEGREKLITKF